MPEQCDLLRTLFSYYQLGCFCAPRPVSKSSGQVKGGLAYLSSYIVLVTALTGELIRFVKCG